MLHVFTSLKASMLAAISFINEYTESFILEQHLLARMILNTCVVNIEGEG